MDTPIAALEIAVRVMSTNGTAVFTTQWSQSEHGPLSVGDHTVALTIPKQFLSPGAYTIDIAAHIPNQKLYDSHSSALALRVEETGSKFSAYSGKNYGMVVCECQWEMLARTADPDMDAFNSGFDA